jgi:hypothetical protein
LAWTDLRQTLGRGITNEIKSISFIICDHCPPLRVDRDAQRDGRVLIKWFPENVSVIQPQLATRTISEILSDSGHHLTDFLIASTLLHDSVPQRLTADECEWVAESQHTKHPRLATINSVRIALFVGPPFDSPQVWLYLNLLCHCRSLSISWD